MKLREAISRLAESSAQQPKEHTSEVASSLRVLAVDVLCELVA